MKNICFKDEILFVFVIYHNIYEFHKRVYLYFIDAYYVFILLSCFTIYRLSKWLGIKKTISGKNKLASGSRNYFVWISLLFYPWQNHWKYQFLPLFWTNPFSLKWTVKNMVELLLKLKIKVKTNGWGKNIQILKLVTLFKDP